MTKSNSRVKCDRVICEGMVFRGEHVCEGFSYYEMGGFLGGRQYMICPCSCHKGETEEETLKKIEEHKNKPKH